MSRDDLIPAAGVMPVLQTDSIGHIGVHSRKSGPCDVHILIWGAGADADATCNLTVEQDRKTRPEAPIRHQRSRQRLPALPLPGWQYPALQSNEAVRAFAIALFRLQELRTIHTYFTKRHTALIYNDDTLGLPHLFRSGHGCLKHRQNGLMSEKKVLI